jgi:predicted Rossmann-fold nucleotide-binding protein
MEVLTLLQTQKLKPIPLILYGSSFWKPLLLWFEQLVDKGYVNREHLDLINVVDSSDEIVSIVGESICL